MPDGPSRDPVVRAGAATELVGRELRRLGLSEDAPPDGPAWRAFLAAVSRAFDVNEVDRRQLAQSAASSSRELEELYWELQRSQTDLRTIVETSPDLVFVIGAAGTIRYANGTMVQVLGYDSPADLLGKRASGEVVLEETADSVPSPASSRERGLDAGALRSRWARRGGDAVVVDATASPIVFQGAPAVLVRGRDVTAKLRAEEQHVRTQQFIRASEERHRLLFEKNPVPILLHDRATLRIQAANDAAVALYGYRLDELLALELSDLEVEEERESASHPRGTPSSGQPRRATGKHRSKDGRTFEMDITSHGITVDGRASVLTIAVDVTETRRLEEQLRHSQKMEAVGQLAGAIAHDFNNLLAVILADAEWITEKLGDGHELAGDVQEVERAAQKAVSLTRQLLAFGRRQLLQPRVLALNALVADFEKMLRRVIGASITLETKLDPALGSVKVDPGQMEQVLMNLALNARDAMPGGGRLVLETRNVDVDEPEGHRLGDLPRGPYVVVAVTDTGTGIDERTLQRVFEPFFTTKPQGKGTGLGLATVFGIVKQSQGAIDVVTRVGEGATFRVYLPRVDAQVPAQVAPARPVRRGGVERVLLVEDDPDMRHVTARILTSRGYTVVTAEDGQQALERFSAGMGAVDLVLTDVVMPGLDGPALAERVREHHPDMRFLYMTGHADVGLLRDGSDRSEASGASEADLVDRGRLLHKPFSADDLSSAVREVLDARR